MRATRRASTDPVAGSRLDNEDLEHDRLAEAAGFDGIMLNEHHTPPP